MSEITTVGLDLAKRVVSLCGEDAAGRVVVQRDAAAGGGAGVVCAAAAVSGRDGGLCSSAHWFARELTALGHTARIIAPEFVRPFRLSGKNDANDAAAICAAVRQPQLRFVTVKSAEQQARWWCIGCARAGRRSARPGSIACVVCSRSSVGSIRTVPRRRWPARARLGRRDAAAGAAPGGGAPARTPARARRTVGRVRPGDRPACARRSARPAGRTLDRRRRVHRQRDGEVHTDGQTDAARTWLTWRPHHEADQRMRAQRAVFSKARVRIDHPTRPDTELQSDPSSPRWHLHFRGSPYRRLGGTACILQPAATLLVEELPCIGPVEATDTH